MKYSKSSCSIREFLGLGSERGTVFDPPRWPSKPKYKILGADIAGRVVAIGKDVKELLPGDEVFGDISGSGWGGFAEYVCARESALSLKPESMTFEEVPAATPQAAVLALQGLRGQKGKIQTGAKDFN